MNKKGHLQDADEEQSARRQQRKKRHSPPRCRRRAAETPAAEHVDEEAEAKVEDAKHEEEGDTTEAQSIEEYFKHRKHICLSKAER